MDEVGIFAALAHVIETCFRARTVTVPDEQPNLLFAGDNRILLVLAA
jgi:hypothetical protein